MDNETKRKSRKCGITDGLKEIDGYRKGSSVALKATERLNKIEKEK